MLEWGPLQTEEGMLNQARSLEMLLILRCCGGYWPGSVAAPRPEAPLTDLRAWTSSREV